MDSNERSILAGSVVRTSNHILWYSCGDWQLSGVSDAYPCIPAYIPEDMFPPGLPQTKRITVYGRSYVKVFGRYGVPLSVHRNTLYPSMEGVIYPFSLGCMVFVRKSHILEIRDPKKFREQFVRDLEEADVVYKSLVRALGISMEDIGISGSVLTIGTPSWRHETDFAVYGEQACTQAFSAIEENRHTGIFSQESLYPYHMPFRYQGRWFDPHFSDAAKERFLHGAMITVLAALEDITLRITDDTAGLFYPVIYHVDEGKKLVSFRSSHRGLYRRGQQVHFLSLSDAEIIFPNGETETVFLVIHDEWGEVLRDS